MSKLLETITEARTARAIIAASAVLVYLNTFNNGYTFDDYAVIAENQLVQQGSPIDIFSQYISMPGSIYRPLTLVTFAVDERSGLNPLGGHVVNVGLHAIVSLLTYSLATRLLVSPSAQLTSGLLFALHPVHTEAVASLVGRAELLAALLALAALVTFARYIESNQRRWLTASLLLFALGPFAKENALTVLPLVPILGWQMRRGTKPRDLVTVTLAFLAAAAPYLVLRTSVLGGLTFPNTIHALDNPLGYLPLRERLATAIAIVGDYVGLLALPIRLSADYSFDQVPIVTSALDGRLLLATTAAALAVAACWKYRHTAAPYCLLFFLCTLSLTSNIPFTIGTIKAERLLYLPSVGWCIGIGLFIGAALRHRYAIVAPCLALMLVFFSARTWIRNYDWADNTKLFRATATSSPNSAKALYNYGLVLQRKGKLKEARVYLLRALQILPSYSSAGQVIGSIYEQKNLAAGALDWYSKMIQITWDARTSHLGLARVRLKLGELDAAEAILRTGLDRWPNDPSFILALAEVLSLRGDDFEAGMLIDRFDQLKWIKPSSRVGMAESRMQIANTIGWPS